MTQAGANVVFNFLKTTWLVHKSPGLSRALDYDRTCRKP
jgi:hypothetical protein